MTLGVKRRRAHDKLAALPGVCAIRRPVSPSAPQEFDLYYVRTGPRSDQPLVIIPGGPGMASIGHYQGLRRRAAEAGLDVIMVEHRGVGMSRHDDAGADLPEEALTIEQVVDDIAAVLDDAGVPAATVYGTSYGSYLAAGMGVRHPGRVGAMILDSPLLNCDDIEIVRWELRSLFWHGRDPHTAELAAKVRRLADHGHMTPGDAQLAATLYGIGGAGLLHRLFDLLLGGRRLLWTAMSRLGSWLTSRKLPYRNEADLVGAIGFRELNFHGTPDGLPLDPAVAMRESVSGEPPDFQGEPFDLIAEMPRFGWPTVVISGGRDLTTPPAVADRIVALVPGAFLVCLATAGHSILDTREQAALRIAAEVCAGRAGQLPAEGDTLDRLPARPEFRVVGPLIEAAARVESALPAVPAERIARLSKGPTS
ncbi:alpha/beta fold hydrolase [Mycolicibacterium sp.]|uniref:alpha/beta hydrolase n=1 Tax=Mycolicibacterium sp. TaxID=2320850 RepID=UPI001D92911A|nr:alpha/beta fold hydrolase [Mycolicibacterium sp.]MCB1291413.1 alpha/beta fold hydrolase [Mycobacterium sp.]MCB9411149.1 alpha/beta fold hydrolase [Mycolicibacterium sp.]